MQHSAKPRLAILYVSQYFPPEMGAPAARVSELARAWVESGADVEVLTGFPNHPTGVIPPDYQPRRLADWVRRESFHGVRVTRVPIYVAPNKDIWRRAAAYASFALSASTFGRALAHRPDVVIATSPQILVGLAGLSLARSFRAPFVFEVRDLWPDSIIAVRALPESSPALVPLRALEKTLYRAADRLVVVSPAFVDPVAARDAPRDRIAVIPNGADLARFDPTLDGTPARVRHGLGNKFVVTYIGTIGMAHGLATLLETAHRLAHRSDLVFLVAGAGAESRDIEARIRAERMDNVRFIGERPRAEVPELLAASDLCAVLLRATPLFKTVLPSKVFEMMAMAKPIVIAVDGEARDLVERRAQAGVFVPPENADALAAAITDLAARPADRAAMGARGLAHVSAYYERRALAARYLTLLEDVVRTKKN